MKPYKELPKLEPYEARYKAYKHLAKAYQYLCRAEYAEPADGGWARGEERDENIKVLLSGIIDLLGSSNLDNYVQEIRFKIECGCMGEPSGDISRSIKR